jgi:hypothetical protein
MAKDDGGVEAARLFHDAWNLLADLTHLRKRLQDPMPLGVLPAESSASRSYGDCVEQLRRSLDLSLRRIIKELEIRNDWPVRAELLPPSSSRFRVDLQAYLRQLDETLDDPEDARRS